MRRQKSDYVILTVSNAFRLLEEFRFAEELGVTELARRLGLHKNNVFRLLATLQEMGFVEQCDNDRYRLGARCLVLGQSFARTRSLTRLGRSVLEGLCAETGETAHLGVLSGSEVVHLDGETPHQHHLVGSRVRTGERLPAHASALGKALLACGDPAEWQRVDREWLKNGELPALTPATITDRDKFFDHLRGAAGMGFAIDIEECALGLCCVAAPVRDSSSHVVGALSVSAPAFRADVDVIHTRLVPAVTAAAQELSRRMGAAG